MKHIFRVLAFISTFAIIGTMGAYDCNTIGLLQAIIQVIFNVILIRTAIVGLNRLNYIAKHSTSCRRCESVNDYTIDNVSAWVQYGMK